MPFIPPKLPNCLTDVGRALVAYLRVQRVYYRSYAFNIPPLEQPSRMDAAFLSVCSQ